jgi:hypothetical protein
MMKYFYLFLLLSFHGTALSEESIKLEADPHYSPIGFFDIHLCNWPERPNYFKILFSSEHYQQIDSMDVYTPDNRLLASLDKTKFMTLKRKNRADKRVYLIDIDAPETATSGWYKINVKTGNGENFEARDYVTMTRLKKATDLSPGNEEEYPLPITLKWKPVKGAQYYQAYIRDVWNEKLVFQSKLITKPEVTVPKSKLQPGNDYYWTVHSRDVNEHILLGDFHMGSMSEKTFFSVAE